MTPVSALTIARFMRLPRRAADTWQGGLVRLPTWVDDPDGTPRRPWGAVWVSLETDLVSVKLESEPDWTVALDALTDLGLKFAHSRPARLEVNDAALGAKLVEALGGRELAVSVSVDLPIVRDKIREMTEALQDGPVPPDALWARGVTVERMRAFATAAREFYEAAPWRHLSDEDLIHVEAPAVGRGFRYVTVLGAAGQTFGLAFFPSVKEFEALQEDDDPEAFLTRGGRWTVLFGPLWGMPFGDVDLWEDHGLPVAGQSAYPIAIWFGPGGEVRRPEASELSDLEAILGALAVSTEDEIDQGRWSHEVRTWDGPRTVMLAISELLEPLDAPPRRRGRGLLDRRAMERVLVEAERFAATAEFTSEAEASLAMQRRFSGPIDDIRSTAVTPLEKAQDMVYRAFEARGRRRIQLARKALALSPDCADAYGILAEESSDLEQARRLYAEGVAAGERAIGPAVFAEQAGHFWGLVSTRPYMRVRFGLAQCLEALGRRDEAIEHYRELLRLNPGDNQGVRDSLLPALMLAGRDDEAGGLLAQFAEEPAALWRYGRALWIFRREGDGRAARHCLQEALRTNRHVPAFLTGDKTWPGREPASYALGSREEAVVCLTQLGEAWRATPGADRWLRASVPNRKSRRRR
jgi:tetratricopeptide (TPR) repeat protein